jgi:hypothetical protein
VLTTEAEAKTKRCQESFAAAVAISENGNTHATTWAPLPNTAPAWGGAGHSTVTSSVYSAPLCCIGSACMAWRWGKIINVYTPGANPQEFTLSQELGGYCGKAGMPIAADKADAT